MLPPPMMRVLPPAAVAATTTAAATALPLASNAAATAPKPDHTEVVDMEVDSPYSPPDSPPHGDSFGKEVAKEADRVVSAFDALLPALAAAERKGRSKGSKKHGRTSSKDRKHIVHFTVDKGRAAIGSLVSTLKVDSKASMRMDESQLKILDELPSSAVEMQVKEKFLKKLNRQERVVEEVKLALKPYYNHREISKEEYKDILRKSVPKVCHNKSGEINPVKIKALVEGYIRRVKHQRNKPSSGQHRHKPS
uniref:Putative phd and ring finger 1 n=1 Tax=Ixodes ricinus TaxID=34613 RepID=V5IBC5_IXORI